MICSKVDLNFMSLDVILTSIILRPSASSDVTNVGATPYWLIRPMAYPSGILSIVWDDA